MAFYKPVKMKSNGKWYPQAVQVDKPFETDEVADRLAAISTVSRADVYAVLKELPSVMGDMMAQGRSVRLEGLGTFRYTINASDKGVDTPEEVGDRQIKGVRVRYVPETRRPNRAGAVTRAIVDTDLRWVRFDGQPADDTADDTADDEDETQGQGGGSQTGPTTPGGSGESGEE